MTHSNDDFEDPFYLKITKIIYSNDNLSGLIQWQPQWVIPMKPQWLIPMTTPMTNFSDNLNG